VIDEPPTLSQVEVAWARDAPILPFMVAAIERHGGASILRDSFDDTDAYDYDVWVERGLEPDPMILGPIVYERVELPDGRPGFRVPAHERERWEAPHAPIERRPVDAETETCESLIDRLEPWTPSFELRALLAVKYHERPVQVSRLTIALLNEPGVRDPCAVLYHRLKRLDTDGT